MLFRVRVIDHLLVVCPVCSMSAVAESQSECVVGVFSQRKIAIFECRMAKNSSRASIYQDPLYYELLVINSRANFHMKDCMGIKDNRGWDEESYNEYLDLYTQTFPDAVEDVMSVGTKGNLHLLKK